MEQAVGLTDAQLTAAGRALRAIYDVLGNSEQGFSDTQICMAAMCAFLCHARQVEPIELIRLLGMGTEAILDHQPMLARAVDTIHREVGAKLISLPTPKIARAGMH